MYKQINILKLIQLCKRIVIRERELYDVLGPFN